MASWASQLRSASKSVPAALLVLSLSLLVSCGSASASGTDAQGTALSNAQFLDDPRSYEGNTTAMLADSAIRPVTDQPTPDLPVTVTDAQGTQTTITDTSRVLALDLYGTASRTVFELGLGESLVGRDISSGFEEIQHLPLVTQDGHNLNAEAILDLAPTLIITDTSLGPWDVMLQMRDAGIPVVVIDSSRTVDNVGDLTRQIAEAMGTPEEGELLAERIDAEVDDMVAQVAQHVPQDEDEKLRMIFLYVRGQAGIYYIFGPGSGTEALIEGIGGIDVAADIGWEGMMPMTDEALVEAQPDLVLMMTNGLESVNGVDGLLESVPALEHTPAGEKRRIVDMADTEVLSFGPNTPGVLEALSVAVYAPESADELVGADR